MQKTLLNPFGRVSPEGMSSGAGCDPVAATAGLTQHAKELAGSRQTILNGVQSITEDPSIGRLWPSCLPDIATLTEERRVKRKANTRFQQHMLVRKKTGVSVQTTAVPSGTRPAGGVQCNYRAADVIQTTDSPPHCTSIL